jgi:eukaryotic-like serine/threonine-protein kinase
MQAESETKVVGVRSKTTRSGPAAAADGLPRGLLIGRYERLYRLGHGGMATVWLGRAVGTAGFEKLVAVKVIHPHLANEPDFVEMFLDEARIAARIRHPNVVEILDLGREDDVFFMVMEYVEGDTLASLLKELRKAGELLPVAAILQIIADACEGLAAAHDLVDPDGVPYHLVHRDVSPHNLLVGIDGRVRVVDFGIMKAAGKRSTTLTGQLRGKLPYMSPEQARGQAIDRRTDLFALGAVLWELCTNERLFGGETDSEILTRVCDCVVPDIASLRNDLPPELIRVVQRSLAPDLERRYRDAHEMLRDVRAAMRACERENEDPRAPLVAITKRYFAPRIEYVRAAARGNANDRASERRSAALDASVRSLADGDADDALRTPTAIVAGQRSSSALREFPEVPTALTPIPAPRSRPWTLWVVLPALGAAAAIAAVSINQRNTALQRDSPVVEASPMVAERGNGGTTVGEESSTVKWRLNTMPQHAKVIIDGRRYEGETPMAVELPRSDQEVTVRFELAGYRPHEESLAPLGNENHSYHLVAIEPEPAIKAAVPNTNLRFTAKKPRGSKPKGASEPSTAPGAPSESTPAPASKPGEGPSEGQLAELPVFGGGKSRPPGG